MLVELILARPPLTVFRICGRSVYIDVPNPDVEIGRRALAGIKATNSHRAVCGIAGKFECGKGDGIYSRISHNSGAELWNAYLQ